jgi:hypothetical protein
MLWPCYSGTYRCAVRRIVHWNLLRLGCCIGWGAVGGCCPVLALDSQITRTAPSPRPPPFNPGAECTDVPVPPERAALESLLAELLEKKLQGG